jgi:hypothetical protein
MSLDAAVTLVVHWLSLRGGAQPGQGRPERLAAQGAINAAPRAGRPESRLLQK